MPYDFLAHAVEPRKAAIIAALDKWIRQRPGLEFGNYGDVKPYRQELRQIAKDLSDARNLLRYVELRDSITADDLLNAQRAYSGRMKIEETDKGVRLEYCTGQYWPTEYRKVVCAILASAIWDWTRANDAATPHETNFGPSAGDRIRKSLRHEFGRNMQARWFD